MVSDFVRSPDLFHFDLAENPAVVALASHPQHAPLHALLTIYLNGSVTDFNAFAASNPAVFASLGVSAEDAAAKMRLLALVGLVPAAAEIKFQDISTSLEIPANEVESVVVQAIGKRLMEARINQLEEVVTVTKCAPRTFGAAQWVELQGQLKAWKESVASVMELGTDERSVLSRGISELSVGA